MPVNPGRRREDGLADLLIGLLHQPSIEPDLLVRFADDPRSLSREERERVELALRDSPAVRDQLRVLQSQELARVLAEGRVSERRASRSAEAPSLFDRLRDFLRGRGGLVLAPLAAAALLAF